jgi:cytoskeletal protein RodZ
MTLGFRSPVVPSMIPVTTSSAHLAQASWLRWQFQRKVKIMSQRIQKAVIAIAAIGALAAGGSAIASAQTQAPAPAPITQSAPTAEPVGGPDTDSIQSGDQTTPDTGTAAGVSSNAAAEAPGTEQSPASEQPGSETAANSDGPGGHADEPGSPTADHQFQGVE